MNLDCKFTRGCDALFEERSANIFDHLTRFEKRFENGLALGCCGHKLDADEIERKDTVAAPAHTGAGTDLIEGVAIEFNRLARAGFGACSAEDTAEALV